jgi:phenylacetate-CoA ligase
MPEFYDELETRAPQVRELDHSSKLPLLIARAMSAPGWAEQLAGVDPRRVTSRTALVELPVLRKAVLKDRQQASPPLGGFAVTSPGKLKRLLMSPGPIFEPEGHGADWWNSARALFAAGFRSGDVVHNSFAYHLTPADSFWSPARMRWAARSCRAASATPSSRWRRSRICGRPATSARPTFSRYCSMPPARPARTPPRSGARWSRAAFPPSLRAELASRGVEAFETYATAELGVIAYETPAREGLVVNESVLLEIVRPGTGDPVADGEVGEVVVTSFNADYPMIRLATGDLSAVLAGRSPCGRTNMRIKGWMGRADQTTKVKGMFVHPGQIAEVARRHPELTRVRLSVTRDAEQDVMTLLAECSAPASGMERAVTASLEAVTKLKGRVTLVAAGSLPNDGKIISDERGYR